MVAGSSSFRILLASIDGGTNSETNAALNNFCSGSYEARRFPLDSERVEVPLGCGRLGRLARSKPKPNSVEVIEKGQRAFGPVENRNSVNR